MKFWISIIISIIATTISVITFFKNRLQLIQVNNISISPVCEGQIKIQYETNGETLFEPLPQGILVHLSFLNPSPQDIAYFSLCFRSYEFDKLKIKVKMIEAYTQKSAGHITNKPVFLYTNNYGYTGELTIPEKPFGKFKATSYTPFYVFLPLRDSDKPFPKKVFLELYYSIRKFPYIGKRNSYRTFTLPIDLSNIEKLLQEQQQIMQQLIKSTKNHPLKSPHKNYF